LFTGEITPTKSGLKDRRRMFFDEMIEKDKNKIVNFFIKNKILIVSDILKGRGKFSAGWILVALIITKESRWVLKSINHAMNIFADGEEVVVTEKIHGTNCKIGNVCGVDIFAGSMEVRRKRPVNKESGAPASFNDPEMKQNIYWFPWSLPGVADLINSLCKNNTKVITLYGEVYGSQIQSLAYGLKGELGFRAFDLNVDGKYLDWDEFESLCKQYGVLTVPVLYRGPFSMEKMKELAEGDSTLPNAVHLREGIVVKPIHERTHPKIGRVVLKYISIAYDLSRHKDKDTKDM
jgi:RNA ligase (TIGR02306 family)